MSFENDTDSLILALRHPAWFRHVRHAAPRRLLAENRWVNAAAGIEWRLLRGDFNTTKFTAPLPDIIFFDPFSFGPTALYGRWARFGNWPICSALMRPSCSPIVIRRACGRRCWRPASMSRRGGARVRRRKRPSPHAAAAASAHGHELLGEEWLAKWGRSDAQAPLGADVDDGGWRDALIGHAQFRGARERRAAGEAAGQATD